LDVAVDLFGAVDVLVGLLEVSDGDAGADLDLSFAGGDLAVWLAWGVLAGLLKGTPSAGLGAGLGAGGAQAARRASAALTDQLRQQVYSLGFVR
jgi:hypothetical protein